MTRREIRETVFKILFSLEFNDISEIREEAELELEHASLYDEDDNKMDAVAMTEEEKSLCYRSSRGSRSPYYRDR